MDARNLTTVLKDPVLLNNMGVEELQEAVTRFPYSSILQTLLLKKLQLNGDRDLDTVLARTALLHPDRKALNRFMDAPFIPAPVEEIEKEIIAETVIEEVKEEANIPVVEEAQTPVIADPTVVAEEPAKEEVAVEEEVIQPIEMAPIEAEVTKEEEVSAATPETPPIAAEEPAIVAPEEPAQEAQPLNIQTDKLPFTEWLKRVKGGAVQDSKELEQMIQAGSYEAILAKQAKEEPVIEAPKEQKAAPIAPKEEPMEKTVDKLAQKSVVLDDDLVTETLAKIYEIQKKYSKAMDAYEKLALKFPEHKQRYLAAIERLRSK